MSAWPSVDGAVFWLSLGILAAAVTTLLGARK